MTTRGRRREPAALARSGAVLRRRSGRLAAGQTSAASYSGTMMAPSSSGTFWYVLTGRWAGLFTPAPQRGPGPRRSGSSCQRIHLPDTEPFDVAREVVEPVERPGSRPSDELRRAVVEGRRAAAVDAGVGGSPAPGIVGLGDLPPGAVARDVHPDLHVHEPVGVEVADDDLHAEPGVVRYAAAVSERVSLGARIGVAGVV